MALEHSFILIEDLFTKNRRTGRYASIGHVSECLSCNGVWLQTMTTANKLEIVNVFGDIPTPCPQLVDTVHQSNLEVGGDQFCTVCGTHLFLSKACSHRVQAMWAGASYSCNCVVCLPMEAHPDFRPIFGGLIYRNVEKEEQA